MHTLDSGCKANENVAREQARARVDQHLFIYRCGSRFHHARTLKHKKNGTNLQLLRTLCSQPQLNFSSSLTQQVRQRPVCHVHTLIHCHVHTLIHCCTTCELLCLPWVKVGMVAAETHSVHQHAVHYLMKWGQTSVTWSVIVPVQRVRNSNLKGLIWETFRCQVWVCGVACAHLLVQTWRRSRVCDSTASLHAARGTNRNVISGF